MRYWQPGLGEGARWAEQADGGAQGTAGVGAVEQGGGDQVRRRGDEW